MRGWVRLAPLRRTSAADRPTIAWVLGCVLLLLATVGRAGPLLADDVRIHMISHMMMSMMVPVLLVLGAGHPGVAGIGTRRRQSGWTTGMDSHRYSQSVGSDRHTSGFVAAVVFVGSLRPSIWAACSRPSSLPCGASAWMNLRFLVSGYVFYWLAIGIDPRPAAGESGGQTGASYGDRCRSTRSSGWR